jgi:hypothetical protein
MIDYHYGHLARDSREHAVSLLDALAIERAVDAGWTPQRPAARPLSTSDSGPAGSDPGESWTFGGRRASKPSPVWLTKGPDQQGLREALYRTRTDDPLLTMIRPAAMFERLPSPRDDLVSVLCPRLRRQCLR